MFGAANIRRVGACARWLAWLRPRMVLVACTAVSAASYSATDGPVAEGTVKMAIIYNIGKFVEWPVTALPASSRDIVLCTLGATEGLQQGLAAIESKPLQGRELKIRRIDRDSELRGCQILYVIDGEQRSLAPLLTESHALSILTIGDGAAFAQGGGIVGLVMVNHRIQFSVNLQAARSANLRISSELLRLATDVRAADRN